MLRDTWVYEDIKQEAQKELQRAYAEEQRHILLTIVQTRFPRIEALVQQLIANKNELELLQKLIIQIGSARLEKDARQSICKVAQEYLSS
jgi:hypothetical protein